jgi:uncharacterized protein YjbI with pentapeptide repeats
MTRLDRRRVRVKRRERIRRWSMMAVIVAGALLLLLGLPWLLWRGPYVIDASYIDETELKKGSAALVTGLRTAVVAFAAALGAGIALFYTARTYRLTRRGQITDRFTKALERLGSDEIYVRIGGILALEQIVRDAPEQAATDAAHVLGHFIRRRTPRALTAPTAALPTLDSQGKALPDAPDADVQAALSALTRAESRTHVDSREKLNLRGLHLAGADLRQADLTGADLSGVTLTKADMYEATLTEADLREATLTKAVLSGATLTKANLSRATLTKAHLPGATLTMANLFRATLTEANLRGATLIEADLSRAILTKTNLRATDLTKAHLHGATLTEANLFMAWMPRADLHGATLTKVSLRKARLMGAYLREATLTETNLFKTALPGADLRGADLSRSAHLSVEQAVEAITNEGTKMPDYFYVRVGLPAVL